MIAFCELLGKAKKADPEPFDGVDAPVEDGPECGGVAKLISISIPMPLAPPSAPGLATICTGADGPPMPIAPASAIDAVLV